MLDWPAGPASSVAVVSRNDCKNYLFIFSGESGGDRTDCSVTPSEGEQPDWREVRELSSAKLVITQVNILHGSPHLPHLPPSPPSPYILGGGLGQHMQTFSLPARPAVI